MGEVVRDHVDNSARPVAVCPACGFLTEDQGFRDGAHNRVAGASRAVVEMHLSPSTYVKMLLLFLFAYAVISRLTAREV